MLQYELNQNQDELQVAKVRPEGSMAKCEEKEDLMEALDVSDKTKAVCALGVRKTFMLWD